MTNYNFQKLKARSFDKSFKAEINYMLPEKYREIVNYSKNCKKIITMGANYSYAPAFFGKKSVCLDLSNFNKILFFSKKKKEITVEAGIKIIDLLNYLLNRGFWIPQIPGYPYITIGGAVAGNVHGKSSAIHGTFKNIVKKILLFHKNHGWINLSNQKNRELFDLTLGGLGLTGTIVTVTLKLVKFNYHNFLTKRYEVNSIMQTINYLNKFKKNKNLLVYSWNDASSLKKFGRGFVYVSKPIASGFKKKIKLSFKKNFFNYEIPFWNKYTSKIFNNLFFRFQKIKKKECIDSFEKTIFPYAGNENYFSFYGKKGFLETQLIVPLIHIDEFFKKFQDYYKTYEPEIILFSIKRINGKKKYIRFESDGICLTFDFTRKKKNLNFLKKIDQLCIQFEIIPSLIKDSRISKSIFNKCFKDSDLFKKKLYRFDKDRIYQSELSRRLKI